MVQTVGFIGFGNINSSLAHYAVKAGYQVILSNSRGPASLSDAVAKLGPQARAATVEEAVRESDLVSVSIPMKAIQHLPAAPFAGKTVIDSNNYYARRDGPIEGMEGFKSVSSVLVQRHLKDSHVVKLFNNIDQFHLQHGARPAGDPQRWTLPMAGDVLEAKAAVAKFADAIGFDTVDCGSLEDSWRFQPNTPAYARPYIAETIPEDLDVNQMLKWVQSDHSKVIHAEQVLKLVAEAETSGEVVYHLPPKYFDMFGAAADAVR